MESFTDVVSCAQESFHLPFVLCKEWLTWTFSSEHSMKMQFFFEEFGTIFSNRMPFFLWRSVLFSSSANGLCVKSLFLMTFADVWVLCSLWQLTQCICFLSLSCTSGMWEKIEKSDKGVIETLSRQITLYNDYALKHFLKKQPTYDEPMIRTVKHLCNDPRTRQSIYSTVYINYAWSSTVLYLQYYDTAQNMSAQSPDLNPGAASLESFLESRVVWRVVARSLY